MMPFQSHKQLEAQCFEAFTPPIGVTEPTGIRHGLIFASPHSGRVYPKGLTRRSHLPLSVLRRNEDAHMDKVVAQLEEYGFPTLQAFFPRCFVDVNRSPDELLPEWQSDEGGSEQAVTARAAAGLGVIPTVIAENLPIYKTTLPPSVVKARIEQLYNPYHSALQSLLGNARRRAGMALLLDCHSMPGMSISGKKRHDIVLGDRFGTSSDPEFMRIAEAVFTEAGYSVGHNYPYAGGYVTSTYGQPYNSVHVIQIEVNRQIYMNPVSFKRLAGFEKLQSTFVRLGETLRPYVGHEVPRAAE